MKLAWKKENTSRQGLDAGVDTGFPVGGGANPPGEGGSQPLDLP